MNALVLDLQTDARNLWQSIFREFGIRVEFTETFPTDVYKPNASPRLLVIDQSVVGFDIDSTLKICSEMNLDVVVITGPEISVASTVRLMKHGASWVFRKELDVQQVREAIPLIQESVRQLQEQISELCRLQALLRQISPRELSVLELVLDGVPNKQIAKQLEVSVRTVESRRAKIYRKCEVTTVTELVRCVDRAQQLRGRYGDCQREMSEAISQTSS